ncbi:MAG TPA: glutathione S-transferase family protein, partial [Steroidobacteraceae bacterium]|nr:glutathione S-transferase family protein [Steroidobacteraceae bacterium]
ERTWMARASGDHQSPEMLARNPRGKFPVVMWGEQALFESLAILHFLDAVHPGRPLLPREHGPLACALIRAHEADNYTAPAMLDVIDPRLMSPSPLPVDEQGLAKNRVLHAELDRWDAYLAQASGGMLAGPELTLADVALFPVVAFCVRCELRLSPRWPALARWYESLVARPSVQSSWPPHWKQGKGRDLGLNET